MLQVRVIFDHVDDLRVVFPSLLMLFAVSVCYAALSVLSHHANSIDVRSTHRGGQA